MAQLHETVEQHSKLYRDLLLGFVRLHVLYHASREAVYGAGVATKLEQHGYNLSPGTLYPLLHDLEAAGMLAREEWVVDGKVRKYYRITVLGNVALDAARRKMLDLVDEVTPADGAD
jgi:PadR family transcriptional regulator, regulatory protein PadR